MLSHWFLMPRKMSPPSFQQDDLSHHQHHRLPQHSVKQETSAVATTATTNNNNSVYARMSPSSLKIHRNSHTIRKPMSLPISSSSGSISSLVATPVGSNIKPHNQQQQQRGRVIIYTHSPKVIHTNPRDFMALVQKLTGMSSNKGAATTSKDAESDVGNRGPAVPNVEYTPPQHHPDKIIDASKNIATHNNNNSSYSTDDNESSSVITEENCSSSTTTTGNMVGQLNPYVSPPMFDLLPSPPNLPLFMPSSSDMLYCSGDPGLYDYMDFNFPYDQIT